MTAPVCEFEPRILRALRVGVVDHQIRQHAASCSGCAEVLSVAGLMSEVRRADLVAAKPPAGGAVWFRIQLRARRATARRSSRAATLIQALSLLAAAIGALALVGIPRIARAASAIPELTFPWVGPLSYAVAALALLGPVAVAVALARR